MEKLGFSKPKDKAKAEEEVKIYKDVDAILKTISQLEWPAGSDADLAVTVWESVKRYLIFKRKWVKKKKALLNKDTNLTLRLTGFFGSPIDFIRDWMLEIQQEITHWPHWRGPLTKWAFSVNTERFSRWGRTFTYEFCCDSKRWDELMKVFLAKGAK